MTLDGVSLWVDNGIVRYYFNDDPVDVDDSADSADDSADDTPGALSADASAHDSPRSHPHSVVMEYADPHWAVAVGELSNDSEPNPEPNPVDVWWGKHWDCASLINTGIVHQISETFDGLLPPLMMPLMPSIHVHGSACAFFGDCAVAPRPLVQDFRFGIPDTGKMQAHAAKADTAVVAPADPLILVVEEEEHDGNVLDHRADSPCWLYL